MTIPFKEAFPWPRFTLIGTTLFFFSASLRALKSVLSTCSHSALFFSAFHWVLPPQRLLCSMVAFNKFVSSPSLNCNVFFLRLFFFSFLSSSKTVQSPYFFLASMGSNLTLTQFAQGLLLYFTFNSHGFKPNLYAEVFFLFSLIFNQDFF